MVERTVALEPSPMIMPDSLPRHLLDGLVCLVGCDKTLQGADLNVVGQGNDLKVNTAGLVCGGVHTANATVYMIDTVLTPPSQ